MLPSIRCCGQILHKGCHPALCLLHLPNSLTVFSLTASLPPLLILPLRLCASAGTLGLHPFPVGMDLTPSHGSVR
jgi:hypothetical protein